MAAPIAKLFLWQSATRVLNCCSLCLWHFATRQNFHDERGTSDFAFLLLFFRVKLAVENNTYGVGVLSSSGLEPFYFLLNRQFYASISRSRYPCLAQTCWWGQQWLLDINLYTTDDAWTSVYCRVLFWWGRKIKLVRAKEKSYAATLLIWWQTAY